jgi:hypothetical protein
MAARYAEQMPERESTYASAFGEACHEVAETALRTNADATRRLTLADAAAAALAKTYAPRSTAANDILAVVEPYIAYVESRARPNVERRIEERVTVVGKDCWGSVDLSLYATFDFLEVIDLKGGAGENVVPDDNEQLMTYAVGLAIANGWLFDRCRLTIVQPRRTDGLPAVLSWECSRDALKAHEKRIKAAIKAAKALDAAPTAGDWCRWCPAHAVCPAQRARTLSVLGTDPADARTVTLPSVDTLRPEQLARVLTHRKAIEAWFEACAEHALSNVPPGMKIVEGGTKRRWRFDPAGVAAELAAAGLDSSPIVRQTLTLAGVTEAEKYFKAEGRPELAERMFEKPRGAPVVVSASDQRPPFDPLRALPDA